jgi:hypothetical protein
MLLDGAEATKIKPGNAKSACQRGRPIASRYDKIAIVY